MKNLFFLLMFTSVSIYHFAQVTDSTKYLMWGKIISKNGSLIKMELTDADVLPPVGVKGRMECHIPTELFGAPTYAYVETGELKLNSIEKDILSFTLLREFTEEKTQGENQELFKVGEKVKFTWKIPTPPDEIQYKKGLRILDYDMPGALYYFKEAIKLNPKNDKALNSIGLVFSQKNQSDSALVYFKRAHTSNKKNIEYLKNISVTYQRLGNLSEAVNYADKAVQVDSTNAEARYLRGVTTYFANKNSLTESQKKKILRDVDRAVEYSGGEAFYYSQRAFLRYEFGDKAGACSDAERVRSMSPEDGYELKEKYCE